MIKELFEEKLLESVDSPVKYTFTQRQINPKAKHFIMTAFRKDVLPEKVVKPNRLKPNKMKNWFALSGFTTTNSPDDIKKGIKATIEVASAVGSENFALGGYGGQMEFSVIVPLPDNISDEQYLATLEKVRSVAKAKRQESISAIRNGVPYIVYCSEDKAEVFNRVIGHSYQQFARNISGMTALPRWEGSDYEYNGVVYRNPQYEFYQFDQWVKVIKFSESPLVKFKQDNN